MESTGSNEGGIEPNEAYFRAMMVLLGYFEIIRMRFFVWRANMKAMQRAIFGRGRSLSVRRFSVDDLLGQFVMSPVEEDPEPETSAPEPETSTPGRPHISNLHIRRPSRGSSQTRGVPAHDECEQRSLAAAEANDMRAAALLADVHQVQQRSVM